MGARRVHREGGELAEVPALHRKLRRALAGLRRLPFDLPREPSPHLSVLEHRLDHVGRPPRIAQLADHPGPAAALTELDERQPTGRRGPAAAAELDPAAALEEQFADQEAPPLGDEDDAPQSVRSQSF
jgi:hypothetical protein